MTLSSFIFLLAALPLLAFAAGNIWARKIRRNQNVALVSLPRHYGYYVGSWLFISTSLLFVLWYAIAPYIIDEIIFNDSTLGTYTKSERDLFILKVKLFAQGSLSASTDPMVESYAHALKHARDLSAKLLFVAIILVGGCSFAWAMRKVKPSLPARAKFDEIIEWLLFFSAGVAIITTLGIVFSLALESSQFFQQVPLSDFLLGTQWSPQTSVREDQIAASGSFGALPLFAGTLLVSAVALSIAAPIGLMSAIYLNQYAKPWLRVIAKPILEILAGIPTVVFGFFAAVTVAPALVGIGDTLNLPIAAESALVAGLVMGVMIIPYVSSLSDDAISAVPKGLIDGSLALGATKSETILRVLIPASGQGILGSLLLAISRAIGETMIVVMAVGMRPNLTANPFEAVTTVTVQIVSLLTGDQEFGQTKTLSAFALGLVLFASTLCFNMVAQRVLKTPAGGRLA